MSFLTRIEARAMYLLAPISPVLCSRRRFRRNFGRPLDLRTPRTLNEKLMWLKLRRYGSDPLVTRCADKYAVRDYVESCGCGDILNELYGAWDRPRDIPWDALPHAFVLKCNHGCGYNILCPDKSALDREAAVRTLNKWLRHDFWRAFAELQYRPIPKKIVCERFLGHGDDLPDYKIYCFHGQPRYILVCEGRSHGKPKFYFFDPDWHFLPITRDGQAAPPDFTLPRPAGLAHMLSAAARLSQPFSFVRVDLYDVEGRVYFGELTFTPGAALDAARLPETARLVGSLLPLPTAQTRRRQAERTHLWHSGTQKSRRRRRSRTSASTRRSRPITNRWSTRPASATPCPPMGCTASPPSGRTRR